jgi:hypothetical protein
MRSEVRSFPGVPKEQMKTRKFIIELELLPTEGAAGYPDAIRIYSGLTQLMDEHPDEWVRCLCGTPIVLSVTDLQANVTVQ